MRVIRFTPRPGGELGSDPLFGVLEEDNLTTSVINGDPLFNGIAKNGQTIKLEEVRYRDWETREKKAKKS